MDENEFLKLEPINSLGKKFQSPKLKNQHDFSTFNT
jgi:hypothetical protein